MTQPPIPAGWYPNPDGTASTRWWDGTEWTAAVIAGSSEEQEEQRRRRKKELRPAWTALWLGIIDTCFSFGLGVLLGPLGLWFGIIGARRAKDLEAKGARRAAIAGIVLACIGTIMGLGWIAMANSL